MGDQYEPLNVGANPPPPPPSNNQYEIPAFGQNNNAGPPPDDAKSNMKSDFKSAMSNKDPSKDEGEGGGKTEDNENKKNAKIGMYTLEVSTELKTFESKTGPSIMVVSDVQQQDQPKKDKSKQSRMETPTEKPGGVTAEEPESTFKPKPLSDKKDLNALRIKFCKKAKIGVIVGTAVLGVANIALIVVSMLIAFVDLFGIFEAPADGSSSSSTKAPK